MHMDTIATVSAAIDLLAAAYPPKPDQRAPLPNLYTAHKQGPNQSTPLPVNATLQATLQRLQEMNRRKDNHT